MTRDLMVLMAACGVLGLMTPPRHNTFAQQYTPPRHRKNGKKPSRKAKLRAKRR